MSPGGQFHPQRLHHRYRGLQGRIAILTERTIELFSGKPGLSHRRAFKDWFQDRMPFAAFSQATQSINPCDWMTSR